jgi:chromosome partitioning protein
VLNQKGGVGKTTTCVNLGAALARRGHRVLLVDMDPQSNLTVHLGADFRAIRKSTYSLLLGEHPLGPAVLPTSDPNLRYVPATLALANAEIQLASAVGRELLLREAIEVWLEDDTAGEAMPRADFVFIDCPPSLGILTMNALCAANEVLLPIQAEFFALQGVAGILESLKAVQRLNRGLQLTMVVPCMVDKRKTLAREVMEEVDKYFGKLVTRTRIRNNVKLAEAPSHGMTIYEYDASSNGAKDYDSLAREVLGEAPVIDAPAVDAPAVDAPAVDAPAVDAPSVDAPSVDAPSVEAPTVDTPAAEEPAAEAPAAADAPPTTDPAGPGEPPAPASQPAVEARPADPPSAPPTGDTTEVIPIPYPEPAVADCAPACPAVPVDESTRESPVAPPPIQPPDSPPPAADACSDGTPDAVRHAPDAPASSDRVVAVANDPWHVAG